MAFSTEALSPRRVARTNRGAFRELLLGGNQTRKYHPEDLWPPKETDPIERDCALVEADGVVPGVKITDH